MKKQFNDSQAEKNELHTQIKYVERKLTVAVNKLESVNKDETIHILREEKHLIQKKFLYLKRKLTDIQSRSNIQEAKEYEKEITELDGKVSSLIHENKQLHQLISLLDDHEVITFENG